MNDRHNSPLLDRICGDLDAVRQRRPLVHNITNYVVMNYTANALLALGASPVMAHAPEEMEDIVGLANALVINIGTLSARWVRSMYLAGRAAGNRPIPVVLDPVGAGATRFRTETARGLMAQNRISIIRGNASENPCPGRERLQDPRGRFHGLPRRHDGRRVRPCEEFRLDRRRDGSRGFT